MKILPLLVVALVVSGCPSRGFYAHVPVASVAVVHSCALAETAFQFRRVGAEVKGELQVALEAAGEAGPSAELKIEGIGPGFEAKGQSSKTLTFSVQSLPALESCIAWGYRPQLGINGCMPQGDTCRAAKPEELVQEYARWKTANPKEAVVKDQK